MTVSLILAARKLGMGELTSRTRWEGRGVRRHLVDMQGCTTVRVARVRRPELEHPLAHVLQNHVSTQPTVKKTDAQAYHSVCGEPGAKDDHLSVLDVVHITEQVVLGQRDVEVASTVRQCAEDALGLGAPLVIV